MAILTQLNIRRKTPDRKRWVMPVDVSDPITKSELQAFPSLLDRYFMKRANHDLLLICRYCFMEKPITDSDLLNAVRTNFGFKKGTVTYSRVAQRMLYDLGMRIR